MSLDGIHVGDFLHFIHQSLNGFQNCSPIGGIFTFLLHIILGRLQLKVGTLVETIVLIYPICRP